MLEDFLRKIIPEGIVVIATLKPGEKFKHRVFNSIDDAVETNLPDGVDTYFALGSLKERSVIIKDKKRIRVSKNVKQMKSFFVDLDIGDKEGKYTSQRAALSDLKNFCKDYDIPAPMIVSSGVGIHAYWPFKKAVDADKWKTLATVFKRVLIEAGVKIDPTRTADMSSVLRLPGTINTKNGAIVKILHDREEISAKHLVKCIASAAVYLDVTVPKKKSAVANVPEHLKALGSNVTSDFPPSDFTKMKEKCRQVQRLVTSGGNTEPDWYAGLGLVRHTTTPVEAAIAISENYPGFDKDELLAKLEQLEEVNPGPSTCARMEENNPDVCRICTYYEKIVSPISLGYDANWNKPDVAQITEDEREELFLEEAIPDSVHDIPFPFKRTDKGITSSIPVAGMPGEFTEEVFCEFDAMPIKRLVDAGKKESYVEWMFTTPNDGKIRLNVPNEYLVNQIELMQFLATNSIIIEPKKQKTMVNFMNAYVRKLIQDAKADQLLSKVGWSDDHKSFVLDTTVYNNDGSSEEHVKSDNLKGSLKGLGSKGALQDWENTIQFYNAPGHDSHRVLTYSSFGSILFHMTGHKGAMVFLSGKSGCGKTTVLRAINSVWGHPVDMGINGTKHGMTDNALPPLLSAFNNLPACVDDMTNWEKDRFSAFMLAVSQGEGKARSTRTGGLAPTSEKWALLAFASSNDDAYNSIFAGTGASDAEAMRLFQIAMTLPKTYTKEEADKFVNEDLMNAYGTAGHAFAEYVTNNYDKVKRRVLKNIAAIDKASGAVSQERFWSAILGCAFTAAQICQELGMLMGFPVKDDLKWAMGQLKRTRNQVKSHNQSPSEILIDFLNHKIAETLTMSVDSEGAPKEPTDEFIPKRSLEVRVEPGTSSLWLAKQTFKDYCSKKGFNYTEIETTLIRGSVVTDPSSLKELGGKCKVFANKGRTRCWKIDMTKL
jgi:energy-coupling factor transporter ATP-binding protein EcfA2